jgi:4-hydroxy-tetrahydrodipicolinate reductase
MLKAIVAGAAGRMGKKLIHMILQSDDIALAGAFEHPENPSVGQDAGQSAGMGHTGVKITGSLEEIVDLGEVVIDFTLPSATMQNLRTVSSRGLSMVIGTTGFAPEDIQEIGELTEKIRCVMAPNMSVGINVMFRIAAEMATILGKDYDIEILEVHHRLKRDAPSGTALRLAGILAEATGRDLEETAVYERRGITGERTDKEIGIQTLRAGDITGEHTVMFGGIGERLELIHRAHNRDNFARGAIRAAKWVVNQPLGLYDMQDVLGIKK